MNSNLCSDFRELLVDFADGELTAVEHRRVADHLDVCPECHAELRLLERSLELARQAWEQSAPVDTEIVPRLPAGGRAPSMSPANRLSTRGRGAIAAGVAACVFLVLWASIAVLRPQPQPDGQVVDVAVVQQATESPLSTERQIERFISLEVRSARLAVAVDLLASQPGLEDEAARAERYLVEISGRTQARP